MFQATRIAVPAYARKADVWLHNMKLADYNEIQVHRGELLGVIHEEVESYLNTTELVYDSDEGFPSLARLTGFYYISDETYETHVNPLWYQISIQTHFLEKPWMDNQEDFDYLGLQVWVRCDPEAWRFSIFRNTDSSVI